MNNSRNRRYLLTINNPLDHGFSREKLIDICKSLNPAYFCMSEEIGLNESTPHVHIYIEFENARYFSSVQKTFNAVPHFDKPYGTPQECKEYVFKEGKWLSDPKGETNLRDTHYEWGSIQINEQGKRSDLEQMYTDVENGLKPYEIVKKNPKMIRYTKQMKEVRQMILSEVFSKEKRFIDVTYISGETGTGKSGYIHEKYPDAFYISNYKNPFDQYDGQNVLVLDEFREDFEIKFLLKLLDIYPLLLPCRYSDTWACFQKVIIISNWPLEDQYRKLKYEDNETYRAFLRRIHRVITIERNKKEYYPSVECYKNGISISLEAFEDEERRTKDSEA